ncbi:MAG: DNA polymerase III subunit beta [Bacteroidetes bacterium]|nr:MAG: DNA polymerase III subunit beta [Bacteroidota bacterium]
MKFIVSSSALLKQLSALSGVLSASNALPILDNFLFQVNKGELNISASDLETTMTASLPVESKDSGTIAVPARLLLDTLKTFPEQPLTFTIDKKKFAIEISSDYGKYKLTGHDGEDFPKIAGIETPSSFEMDVDTLGKAISKTLFAVGSDELRPVMCGVFVQLETNGITFVATDAHKLVRFKRSDAKSKKATSYIIPKKPLALLRNILIGDGKVKVEYNNTNVSFSFGNILLISRLIDGKYPNYDAVIPKENPNKMIVDRESFLNSIRRVSIYANKTTHQVRLKVKGSELNISAEDLDFSNEANERLTCNYKGEDMEIGFNSKFLAEMLSNIDCEEVQFEMSSPNRAGVMVPSKNGNKEEDILMLVMPVMLNN